jgi:hypothetical protein
MTRPVGLILSAIVLGLAALFLLLITALTAIAGLFGAHQPTIAASPQLFTYFVLAISLFYAVLAAWAILTVIGILRLRSWARYSILVIGGGLSVIGVLAAVGTLLSRFMLPTLQTQQPTVDPRIMSVIFMIMTAIYLLVAAIGVWWLIYFNLRSTRELFSNPSILSASNSANGRFSRAPNAIKIIGGFLLFSSACCLLSAFLPFPAFLFGFILPPAATHVLYLGFAAITAFAGYGLLRLKESARLLTIAFLALGCCNILLATLPWYRTQFCLYMAQLTASMPMQTRQSQLFSSYTVALIFLSGIVGLILYGFAFWLLRRHRAAFQTPQPMLEA